MGKYMKLQSRKFALVEVKIILWAKVTQVGNLFTNIYNVRNLNDFFD